MQTWCNLADNILCDVVFYTEPDGIQIDYVYVNDSDIRDLLTDKAIEILEKQCEDYCRERD